MTHAPDLADFQAVLAKLATDAGFSGAVIVTRGGQQLFAAAYGYANRAWRAPCTLETRFDTTSVTKLFTAVATLQLVERGAFGLDTSVVEYLGLEGTTISAAVTPYHLLTHTSSIADDADEEAGERYEDLWASQPNYSVTQTADHLPHFVTKPPNFAPGEGCRYCNCGYVLLGLMIERASGASYRDHVRASVFEPAGMQRAGFFRMDVVEPDVAEGVEAVRDTQGQVMGWRRNIYSYPPIGTSDSGAYLTVGDLVAFRLALAGGKLLGSDLTAAVLRPQVVHSRRSGMRLMMGYGLEFKVTDDGRVRSYQKDGQRRRQRAATALPRSRSDLGDLGGRSGGHPGTGRDLRRRRPTTLAIGAEVAASALGAAVGLPRARGVAPVGARRAIPAGSGWGAAGEAAATSSARPGHPRGRPCWWPPR